jgi:hypothetical protein
LAGSLKFSFSSFAFATIAAANGCSLARSRLAASRRSSLPEIPGKFSVVENATTFGFPSVSVPVLSKTMVSTFSIVSSASAFLMSTPSCAPRPVPTMIDIGVARPSAHGHAMISTATAFTMACAKRGSGPKVTHPMNVTNAIAITAGTNQPATLSASRWIGARVRCAWLTICTICASMVSLPTRSARITRDPLPFMVAPITREAAVFSTGADSPVIMDSSTALSPSSTMPSTGIFSPGRTRSRSPGFTSSSGTSRSEPLSLIRRAIFGLRSSSARIALDVWLRARSSNTCPSNTRVTIAAAASKYTSGRSPMV